MIAYIISKEILKYHETEEVYSTSLVSNPQLAKFYCAATLVNCANTIKIIQQVRQ